ncbi:cytochrome P450 6k1-like isoform X1 [Anoplophora glabripennis]|uniref:cytochrome P450 6k1-like isoform X2 n=1 Tax=Anoplophora glabripennis TaxID=217634 RepID=UPI0008753A14|nr:cytochrome P450 6k1-like isoform X2 [Anoplophora glabripennis]XP_023312986.1 cytochrome P450 6k1-like isoform X1 [Anoplophora glabripennis]
MLLTSTWILDLIIFFGIGIIFMYIYSTRKYDYFKKRNIHYEKPIPLFGSIFPVLSMKTTIGEWLRQLCNSTSAPYFGIFVFDEPYIIIKSPEIIKHILVKDFSNFSDRTVLAPKHNKIMSNMLFVQKNPDWRKVRSKMSPVFSSGKLKGMLSIINEVGVDLNRYIRENLGQLETKEVTAKYSTDAISKCAFAINSHSFKDENSDFRKVGRAFFDFTWRNGFVQIAYFFKQNWASTLRLEFFEKWSLAFLRDIFWKAIEKRQQIGVKGNDLIDIIVEMRNNKDLCEELNFDGDKVVAQAVQFFAAGFETTSSTLSYTLYELSLQPTLQTKLRNEIISNIKKHDGITYEGLKQMKYMDMCIFEALRKYPVLPFLDRRCNEDYKVPGTDLTIEKGMPVYIPLMALHYDEHYFPEPEKYDPERFSESNKHNVNGLYYMPFGEGPRICIGERFGMLGVKVGLSHILSEFVLERSPETPVPVKFEPKSFLLQSTVGLPLRYREFQPTAA